MFQASSLPIIRSFLLYIRHWLSFMQVFDDRFQEESGWNSCSVLTLLGIYSVIILYMFWASSVPIIRSFLLYIRHWLSFM